MDKVEEEETGGRKGSLKEPQEKDLLVRVAAESQRGNQVNSDQLEVSTTVVREEETELRSQRAKDPHPYSPHKVTLRASSGQAAPQPRLGSAPMEGQAGLS